MISSDVVSRGSGPSNCDTKGDSSRVLSGGDDPSVGVTLGEFDLRFRRRNWLGDRAILTMLDVVAMQAM